MFDRINKAINDQPLVQDLKEMGRKLKDVNKHAQDELSRTIGPVVTKVIDFIKAKLSDQKDPVDDEITGV